MVVADKWLNKVNWNAFVSKHYSITKELSLLGIRNSLYLIPCQFYPEMFFALITLPNNSTNKTTGSIWCRQFLPERAFQSFSLGSLLSVVKPRPYNWFRVQSQGVLPITNIFLSSFTFKWQILTLHVIGYARAALEKGMHSKALKYETYEYHKIISELKKNCGQSIYFPHSTNIVLRIILISRLYLGK